MNDFPHHGSLATRLAALQQRIVVSRQPVRNSFRDGGSPVASDVVVDAVVPLPLRERLGEGANQSTRTAGVPLTQPSPAGGEGLHVAPLSRNTQHPTPILIGASKSQPAPMLEAAIALGLMDFGENKVQEAQSKWPALKARHPEVRLHLIGPLQSNKAADAVTLFDVIHTIDRTKIADALASACEKLGYCLNQGSVGAMAAPSREQREARGSGSGGETPAALKAPPKFLLQVNTGEEPQKAGVAPREVAALLAHCRGLGLPIIGLMCVPPEGENPAPHFALLKKMADELGLPELSMGMSGDYETALRLGATMVRVGTALFGARESVLSS